MTQVAPDTPGIEYLHAVEFAPFPVVGLDAHGRIRLFSREAERMTGLARDGLLERHSLETIFAGVSSADRKIIVELLSYEAATKTAVLACPLPAFGDRYRHIAWTFVRIPQGTVADVVVFAFGEDPAGREERWRKAREAERTATVAGLTTSLAHEIRNPLNGALLHVHVLQRAFKTQGINGECRKALGVIRNELNRLSALMTEFLEFARPAPARPKRVAARALVDRVSALAAERLERTGIVLDVEIADHVLSTDSARLERALEELVANAVDASPRGGRIMLRLNTTDDHEVIEVEDGGMGLARPELAIFDPFVSTKPKGTGLGLSIVQRIVTDLGGAIGYERRADRTVFCIKLPNPARVD